MPPVQSLPVNKYITFWAEWNGVVPLLQDQYRILDGEEHKVQMLGALTHVPPGHPPTGDTMPRATQGKDIQYVQGS